MRKNLRKIADGFTLIELLVVIAVIAVLAAMLMPVYVNAQKSSQMAVCASNMSQFGKVFQMYADSWDGRLPLPGGAMNEKSGMNWINDDSGTDTGALMPLIRTTRKANAQNNFWPCPTAARVNTSISAVSYSPGQTYIMNDYIRSGHFGQVNQPQINDPLWLCGMQISQPQRPSKTILMYEGVQDVMGACPRHGSPFYQGDTKRAGMVNPKYSARFTYPGLAQDYHNGKSNFLMIDGHVELLNPAKTLSQRTYDSTEVYSSSKKNWAAWKKAYPTAGDYDYWNPRTYKNFP